MSFTERQLLPSPKQLKEEFFLEEAAAQFVLSSRQTIQRIMEGEDSRLLVIVGPCSIHDPEGALDYARRLKLLADEYSKTLFVVMRVYFEKPRTTLGWKGFIHDPDLNGNIDIDKGLRLGRKLLLDINALGVPVATEFLEPLIPPYLADCVSWAAIGARTTESQIHREMASGLPMPVGFKNGTSGNIQIALDAIYAASHPHHFLGINSEGFAAMLKTSGNPYTHIVLRGSLNQGPNYQKPIVNQTLEGLSRLGLRPQVMIDCSHGNSEKNYLKQVEVIQGLSGRIPTEKAIMGLMIESYLKPGCQPLSETLEYGVSITDPCIGWEDTVKSLGSVAKKLSESCVVVA